MRNGEPKFFQIESWKGRGGVVHGFGRRAPGPEKPIRRDWSGKSIEEENESFPLVSLRQVHGDRVVVFDGDIKKVGLLWQEEGDCLITQAPGFALAVFTADCLPIFLYDLRQEAIGIVHAGWRGTAKGVAKKAVEKMKVLFHSRNEDILAGLGPCIGPCCYEVDRPVKEAFRDIGLPWEAISHPKGEGKWLLDLSLANSLLLEAAGIRKENVEALKTCTACRQDTFYSYRNADKHGGRQLNFVALRKEVAKRNNLGYSEIDPSKL